MSNPDLLDALRKRLGRPQAPPADATQVTAPVTGSVPQAPSLEAALRPAREAAIQRAVEFIARHEGFRPQAYTDMAGRNHPVTVGYGQTGPDVTLDTQVTEPEARAMLAARVRQDADRLAQQGLPVHPALLSFVYNAGHGRLRSSGALDAALRNDWTAVGNAMMQVVRGRNARHEPVVLPGLVRRRREEVALLQDLLQGGVP